MIDELKVAMHVDRAKRYRQAHPGISMTEALSRTAEPRAEQPVPLQAPRRRPSAEEQQLHIEKARQYMRLHACSMGDALKAVVRM